MAEFQDRELKCVDCGSDFIFSAGEQQFLDLMLHGERKTTIFARALGIEKLSPSAQESEVKRVKDKLKKRIERRTHG